MQEMCSHLQLGIFTPSLKWFYLQAEGEVLILEEYGLKTKMRVQGSLGERARQESGEKKEKKVIEKYMNDKSGENVRDKYGEEKLPKKKKRTFFFS